ncbi:ABC-type sugar transport system, periplasmic component [Opitutaceae bacterium TAV1]|nr:sugar ABC transporter substrate-binding protein [Opitutaceae bacterium TAV5]EIP96477.1 ABC-type sugar transport system, periplasmic component [Opitutaceae bacterium TAV1]
MNAKIAPPGKSIRRLFLLASALSVLSALLAAGCSKQSGSATAPGASSGEKRTYRFVVIPKVVHPWFDKVNTGARAAAAMLSEQTGHKFEIDYRAPQTADVVVQNEILERSIATRPDGIAFDLLDGEGNRAVLQEALNRKIPVILFDSEAPPGMQLSNVGSDYAVQAELAAERLAKLLNYEGEVAIMQGVPTAPNHRRRAEVHREVFAKYPKMKVVAEGIDNDDIETAQKEAARIISAHPNLRGWVSCDAAGPIGVGLAVKEAGKTGRILSVGLDDLAQLIQLIKEGVVESSSSSKPHMQGYWSVICLWLQTQGITTPEKLDTGVSFITRDMTENYKDL